MLLIIKFGSLFEESLLKLAGFVFWASSNIVEFPIIE